MYRAIGDASFQDGVFSQGAQQQAYQASLKQFADGALGGGDRRLHRLTRQRVRAQSGMGNTFLPAFTPRQMKGLGLGHAFRDGVLGDDSTAATTALPSSATITLPSITTTPATPAPTKWSPDVASVGIGMIVGGLLFYALKH